MGALCDVHGGLLSVTARVRLDHLRSPAAGSARLIREVRALEGDELRRLASLARVDDVEDARWLDDLLVERGADRVLDAAAGGDDSG